MEEFEKEEIKEELGLGLSPDKKTSVKHIPLTRLIIASLIGALLGGLIASLATVYFLGALPSLWGGKSKGSQGEIIITKREKPVSYTSQGTIAVAKKVRPSVVNIRIKKAAFGFFGEELEESGVGSGVIFRKDGYILTNNHVVAGADQIYVAIGNEPDVKGKVIGRDSETDLAVVKVEKDNLPAAEIGTSSDLEVGELVVAIGSPFGFEHTVTAGIVSALHRNITTTDDEGNTVTYVDLIQTDAAINPGNSGGALCNGNGEVIGINTLIASTTGGYQGVGFAIPIDVAIDVAEQLITKGEVSHPYMGVSLITVDEDISKQYRLPVKKGALVASVGRGTPADKAGIKSGDVIIAFNNIPISDTEGLIAAIRKSKVGEKVKVTFVRNGEKKTVELILVEKPRRFSS